MAAILNDENAKVLTTKRVSKKPASAPTHKADEDEEEDDEDAAAPEEDDDEDGDEVDKFCFLILFKYNVGCRSTRLQRKARSRTTTMNRCPYPTSPSLLPSPPDLIRTCTVFPGNKNACMTR